MNQSELARKSSVTASYLEPLEVGKFGTPSVEKLTNIAGPRRPAGRPDWRGRAAGRGRGRADRAPGAGRPPGWWPRPSTRCCWLEPRRRGDLVDRRQSPGRPAGVRLTRPRVAIFFAMRSQRPWPCYPEIRCAGLRQRTVGPVISSGLRVHAGGYRTRHTGWWTVSGSVAAYSLCVGRALGRCRSASIMGVHMLLEAARRATPAEYRETTEYVGCLGHRRRRRRTRRSGAERRGCRANHAGGHTRDGAAGGSPGPRRCGGMGGALLAILDAEGWRAGCRGRPART